MEGFIIFLVIAGISFFVNNLKGDNKNTTEKRKQMPPIGQGPSTKQNPQQSRSGLGDYMKKVADELDKQFAEPVKKEVQKKAPAYEETFVRGAAQELAREQGLKQQELMAIREKAIAMQNTRKKTLNKSNHQGNSLKGSLIPASKKGMAQAIIMSEILAPPISKRPKK